MCYRLHRLNAVSLKRHTLRLALLTHIPMIGIVAHIYLLLPMAPPILPQTPEWCMVKWYIHIIGLYQDNIYYNTIYKPCKLNLLAFLAAESNPWSFGVYALSGLSQVKVGGFSIVAQQTPCGATSTSQNKETKAN